MDVVMISLHTVLMYIGGVHGTLHTSTISYLEPVYYDLHSLRHQHRTRRSTSDTINLKFEAFSREWQLRLRPDTSIYSPDLVIENSKGPVTFDMTSAYTGHIEGEKSHVFGSVLSSGHFEGQISINNSSFIIEKATRHNISSDTYHTVIYNTQDVVTSGYANFCHPIKLSKPREVKSGITKTVYDKSDDFKTFQLRYTTNRDKDYKRIKRAVDPNKRICELYVQVDHTLFFKFKNVTDDMISSINNHVMAVNSMFDTIDFDGDSLPDNIGFSIKRIKIYDDPTEPGYKYSGYYGVNSMLYLHSELNYDAFCLSYMFTYRDFDNGILGLAWTAEPSTSGGLCARYTTYTDGELSLNSGIVTFLNYGNDVPTAVSYTTLAHEIGHNFGSWHDETSNPTCAPGGTEGNYIMFAQATTGTKPNNVKFSSCSISQMAPMVASRGQDSSSGCFVPYSGSTCGNKVVETGEVCDCGWDEECADTCCYPSLAAGGPDADKACTLKASATCSPTQGVCCNPSTCTPYTAGDNHVCRTNSSCLDKAVCNGALDCPASTSSANGTICSDEKVCFKGECSSLVCQAHGFDQCQCTPTTSNDWKDPLLCTLCCIDPSDRTCKPASDISGISLPFTEAVPGTPCNNFLGYCDVFHICREVDPSGPLSTLKNFLLHGELINKVKDFLIEHWYVAIAGGVGLIIIMVLLIKCCSKSSKSSKSKVGPEPRHINVQSRPPVHTRY